MNLDEPRADRSGRFAAPAPAAWSTLSHSPLTPQLQGYPRLLALNGKVYAIDGAPGLTTAASADGCEWTALDSNLPYREFSAAVVHKGKLYVAGGYAGANVAAWEVWSSSDGGHWTQMAQHDIVPVADHMLASHRGELLMIAGYECLDLRARLINAILHSKDDGATWSGDRPPAFAPRAGAAMAVFKDRLWVFGGNTARGPVADAWVRDDDDRTWSQPQPDVPWAPRYRHLAQVIGDTLYVGLGLGPGDIPLNDLWATNDGVNWRLADGSGPRPPLAAGFAAAAFGEGLLLVDCAGPGTPGAIHRYGPVG